MRNDEFEYAWATADRYQISTSGQCYAVRGAWLGLIVSFRAHISPCLMFVDLRSFGFGWSARPGRHARSNSQLDPAHRIANEPGPPHCFFFLELWYVHAHGYPDAIGF